MATDPIVITGHPKMRERRIANLRRRRRRDDLITASLGAVLAIVLVTMGVLRSPLMAVETVSVVGLTAAQRTVVTDQINVAGGTNVLDVDLEQVRERVQSLPWVRQVSTRRRLPSTIEIRVAVSHPVLVATNQGMRYLLDADGTVLEAEPMIDSDRDLITVDSAATLPSVVSLAPLTVGQSITDPDLLATTSVAAVMPPIFDNWIVGYDSIGAGEVNVNFRIPTQSGPAEFVVHLGRAENVRAKAATLAALVGETIDRGMRPSLMDVSIPDRPFIQT
ncbi:MAG: cell division protein FtsQ/DivIB [Euzebya sp.]